MERTEFAKIMFFISHGVNKPLAEGAMEVYFCLLRDLPVEALQVAAYRVLLTHKWANFPTVAELREAATETLRGKVVELSPAEAWAMAWGAIKKIDPDVKGSIQRACAGLPPLVWEAMQAVGIPVLCSPREKVSFLTDRFVKFYEQLLNREKQRALLPPDLAKKIEVIGQLPQQIRALTQSVGRPIDESV